MLQNAIQHKIQAFLNRRYIFLSKKAPEPLRRNFSGPGPAVGPARASEEWLMIQAFGLERPARAIVNERPSRQLAGRGTVRPGCGLPPWRPSLTRRNGIKKSLMMINLTFIRAVSGCSSLITAVLHSLFGIANLVSPSQVSTRPRPGCCVAMKISA
jgi:hypothetical protein